ncbi:MAG TPA: hypothetical protein VFD37_01140, partial [Solirubrobacterales bacterium]|nr:hypothetical protein [Solirubrobacterales bacterium]
MNSFDKFAIARAPICAGYESSATPWASVELPPAKKMPVLSIAISSSPNHDRVTSHEFHRPVV